MIKILQSIRRIYLGYETEETQMSLPHVFLIEILWVFRYKRTVGVHRERRKLEKKNGLRLHCPFTKQLRCTQFCEGKFLNSETQSSYLLLLYLYSKTAENYIVSANTSSAVILSAWRLHKIDPINKENGIRIICCGRNHSKQGNLGQVAQALVQLHVE